MDPTLPQMQSFDFDRLDPVALEDTLAYLRQHPEPPAEDIALFGSYQCLLDDAVAERDWMAEPLQDMDQSRVALGRRRVNTMSPHSGNTTFVGFSRSYQYVSAGQMAAGEFTTLPQPSEAVRNSNTFNGWSNCTWDGCQQRFQAPELIVHLESHSREALSQWNKGSKCTWQGCKSKAAFKTLRLFEEHLKNIHTEPLVCTERGCPYKKPFRNKDDLNRHESTKHHTEQKWECPYDSCSSETRTFARRDKWLKHIREKQHENDAFCPYDHCKFGTLQSGVGFETRREIVDHFRLYHPGKDGEKFECALGSCGRSRHGDRWDEFSLWDHLLDHHRIFVNRFELLISLGETNRIFSRQHIPANYLDKWVDCSICASQVQTPLDIAMKPGAIHGAAPF